MKSSKIRQLTLVSVLMALQLVLGSLFSVQFLFTKISFAFIPMAICAYLFGPWVTANSSGLAYLLGMLLFPKFAFFLGFAVSAWLAGLIYGYLLYHQISLGRILLANVLVTFGLYLFLNSLWLHWMYRTDWAALFAVRLPQEALTVVIYSVVLVVLNQRYFTNKLRALV